MKQPKYSRHPNYGASFERQFLVCLQTERLEKDLWIRGLMDCLSERGKVAALIGVDTLPT